MNFRYKNSYLRRFDRLTSSERQLVILADKEIRDYYATRGAHYGLRIKKLYVSGTDKIFEARISIGLRILWIESRDLISFAFLGDHDELKNYLKELR